MALGTNLEQSRKGQMCGPCMHEDRLLEHAQRLLELPAHLELMVTKSVVLSLSLRRPGGQ